MLNSKTYRIHFCELQISYVTFFGYQKQGVYIFLYDLTNENLDSDPLLMREIWRISAPDPLRKHL